MNEETINRLKDYAKKLHDRRLVLDPNIARELTVSGRHSGQFQLTHALGKALNDYDTTDPKYSDYYDALAFFNRCIDMAVANNAFNDNKIVEELEGYKKKCSELEVQHSTDQSTIKKLEHIITELRTRIRIFISINPELKKIGSEESELTDG